VCVCVCVCVCDILIVDILKYRNMQVQCIRLLYLTVLISISLLLKTLKLVSMFWNMIAGF